MTLYIVLYFCMMLLIAVWCGLSKDMDTPYVIEAICLVSVLWPLTIIWCLLYYAISIGSSFRKKLNVKKED